MKRTLCVFMVLACIGAGGFSLVMAEPVVRGFGFGGPMAMAFFPDMTGVNTFMSENGLPSIGSFLIGAGGGGRGGVIGGPAFGGIGWGMVAESANDELRAELISAGGGVDVGTAIGGDDSSVLTIGAVLGGGANILSLSGYVTQPVGPEGLVIEPTYREIGLATGFVQPYVSMAAQLLPWMGFELRLGYILPVFGVEFGDLFGIPAPSLKMSGPTVSLGLTFGGIGWAAESEKVEGPGGKAQVTAVSEGTFAIEAGQLLVIENAAGDVVISGGAGMTQTASYLVATWQATRTCNERRIDELQAVIDSSDTGTTLKTVGDGRVDYVLQVPAGIDLTVRNGAGIVDLTGHEGQTIIVENGAGEVRLQGVDSLALIVALGVGRLDLSDVNARALIAEVGIGEIVLALPATASATLKAKASIGDVSVDRFPGMIGGVHGFFGRTADVTLGQGERTVELNVGIGRIGIEMRIP